MDNTSSNMRKYWIHVLPFGEENAIHQKELAKRLNIKPDKLKAEIRAARIRGVEICSTQAGYFLPKDDLERRRFVTMQEKQAITRFKTCKAIRDALRSSKGQITIDDMQEERPE